MFDISSQWKQKLRSKQRSKIVKIYTVLDWVIQPTSRYDFLCLTWWIINEFEHNMAKIDTLFLTTIVKNPPPFEAAHTYIALTRKYMNRLGMLGRKLSSTSTLSWECSHDKASFNFLLCDWIFLLLIIWFWVQFGINLLEWVFQEAAISVQWLAPRETVSFASPKTNCFPHDLSLSVMPPSWKTVCSMLAGTQIYFCFKEYGLIMCYSKVQAVVSLGSWWVFTPDT